MSTPISLDLRQRIADAYQAGDGANRDIAARFLVSLSTVEMVARRVRAGQELEHKSPPGRERLLQQKHLDWVKARLELDPYTTSYGLWARFSKRFPKLKVSRSTVLRAMHQVNMSYKKNSNRTSA